MINGKDSSQTRIITEKLKKKSEQDVVVDSFVVIPLRRFDFLQILNLLAESTLSTVAI